LRAGLRFDGVLLSDDMDMKVIKASGINQQSLAALQAGMDMLLVTRPEQALWLHAFLLKAAQSGELPQARIDEAVRRTLRLKAAHGLATFDPPAAQPPDYAVNYQLAYELGGNALYIYRDRDALIDRFAQFRRILVVGPVENPGEGWKFYDKELKPVLESAGHELAFRFYTTERKLAVQEQGLLDEILADAPQYDLALVFTSLARVNHILVGDAWQGELVNRLLQGGQPVIVVAMSAATDLLEFPEAPAYIAMFGYTDGARQALVDVLLGRREAAGVNPLPGLP
jgi:beta-N-acetylhexosaminidase